MPDPVEPEKKESPVEITLQEPEKQIVIEPEPKKTEVQIKPEDIEKLHKRMEYQTRQVEKALRQLGELSQKLSTSQVPSQPQAGGASQSQDELDRIAEQDWKQAVKLIGRKAAEELLIELSQKQQEDVQRQEFAKQIDASKSRVLKKYPSAMDESSEESKALVESINELSLEDPTLLRNPRAWELAMYRMEERAGTRKPTSDMQNQIDKEVIRRTRIGAGTLPPGRAASEEDRIVLTQDEKEYCDRLAIPYDRYNKMRKLGEKTLKEGVTANG